MLSLSFFFNQHVPRTQLIPPQPSPDQETCQGKAQKEQLPNSPFLPGLPSILLALPSPPHATLPGLFPLLFLLLFPLFTGLLSPRPVPPLAFSPSHSLAFHTCPFPGVNRDVMDCVLVPSSAFIREGEEKEEKKSLNPWKLPRRQYSGRVTLLLLSLHAALLSAWRKDYLGCSKGTLLPGLQCFGRANLAAGVGGTEG